jgi:hypothetical protein
LAIFLSVYYPSPLTCTALSVVGREPSDAAHSAHSRRPSPWRHGSPAVTVQAFTTTCKGRGVYLAKEARRAEWVRWSTLHTTVSP